MPFTPTVARAIRAWTIPRYADVHLAEKTRLPRGTGVLSSSGARFLARREDGTGYVTVLENPNPKCTVS